VEGVLSDGHPYSDLVERIIAQTATWRSRVLLVDAGGLRSRVYAGSNRSYSNALASLTIGQTIVVGT
jgi:hypothetical protein